MLTDYSLYVNSPNQYLNSLYI